MSEINRMLDHVIKNNLVESTDSFKAILANKIKDKLLESKKSIYSERYAANLDKNKNGKLDADDFKKMRDKKHTCNSSCTEETENTLDEVLNPSMGIHAYIDDFIKSKNSRFDKDSIDKRRRRAIAAFYADKK